MAIYVGGDTHNIDFIPDYLVANDPTSVVNLYRANIDPDNPPAPDSTVWKKITDQRWLDKIKQQNGYTTVETASNSVNANILSTNAPIDGVMNVEIEGNTLKNELVNGDFSDGTSGWGGAYSTNSVSNNILFNTGDGTGYSPLTYQNTSVPINTSAKYYVRATLKVTNAVCDKFRIIYDGSISGSDKTITEFLNPTINTQYIISAIGTPPSDATGNLKVIFRHGYADAATANGKVMEVQEVMAIDLTALGLESKTVAELDAIQWFDGIKSVGEDAGGVGVHEIEVLSRGKNLFDGLGLMRSGINSADGVVSENSSTTRVATKQYKVKANTNYVIKTNSSNIIIRGGQQYDVYSQNIGILFNDGTYSEKTFLTSPSASLIRISFAKTNLIDNLTIEEVLACNIQLEEGTVATAYTPYQEDKIDISSTQPLSRLPNQVSDILGSDGVIRRKIGKRAYITGDENDATLITDMVNTLYPLETPTTEDTGTQLTLQSYANGTLQVDSLIPPYIKESHTINIDDEGVMSYGSSTTGVVPAILIEADLSNVATALNVDNAGLKALLKSITANVWAMGSGASGGILVYGCISRFWYANGLKWIEDNYSTYKQNSNSTISMLMPNTLSPTGYFTVTNRFYLLLYSTNPSDGTIPSQLSLDYFTLKTQLSRVNDIPDSIPIYLPSTYQMVLQGFSPAYTESTAVKTRILWHCKKDADNYLQLSYNYNTKKFDFVKCVGGVAVTLSSNVQTFNRWQIYNIVFGQSDTGMFLDLRKNNGTKESYSNIDTTGFTGVCSGYLLTKDSIGNEGDGWISRVAVKSSVDDSTGILDMSGEGWESPDLLRPWISRVQYINVFPNNRYKILATLTSKGYSVSCYYNDCLLDANPTTPQGEDGTILTVYDEDADSWEQTINGEAFNTDLVFITPNNCNKVKITLSDMLETGDTMSMKLYM